MDTVEIVKFIGSLVGYALSVITLGGLVIGKITGRVGIFVRKQAKVNETEKKIAKIEQNIERDSIETKAFREKLSKSLEDIKSGISQCKEANKELLGAHIEEMYIRGKDNKTLTEPEAQKLSHIFRLYTEYGGNSYAASLYKKMMNEWEIE